MAEGYSRKLGQNESALLYVITEAAGRPPKSPFVHGDQHEFQRSAGSWVAELSTECREACFDVIAHLDKFRTEPQGRPDTRQFLEVYGPGPPPRGD